MRESIQFHQFPIGGINLMTAATARSFPRHAYVLPGQQRLGIGSSLIKHLRQASSRRMLVGTWATASWAIDFYRRHGFALVSDDEKTRLLRTYGTFLRGK